MLRHLSKYGGDSILAFSPDGIDDMNRNIRDLNRGRSHQPIRKVRVFEKAEKYAVGETGNKSAKFVEAAKGTNLFFVVSEKEVVNKQTGCIEKKRTFRTVPLNEAIIKMKAGEPLAEEALFVLSPNDLVYLPTKEEITSGRFTMPIDRNRIYKMVSSNKFQCFFIPERVSSQIQDKYEFSPLNKMERAITGEMVKEICVPIKVDRLGNIIKIGY